MKKSFKFIVAVMLLLFLFGNVCYAATEPFTFAFTTSGTQTGGMGGKDRSTKSVSAYTNTSSNVNSSRYISAWATNLDGSKISNYLTLKTKGATTSASYTSPLYKGGVYLKGTPSQIGAAASGIWYS